MSDPAFPIGTLIGAPAAPQPTPDEEFARGIDRPGMLKTFGAAFRTDNTVGSFLSANDVTDPMVKDDTFDWNKAYSAMPAEDRIAYGSKLVDIHNQRAWDAVQSQIAREKDDARTLATTPWYLRIPAEMTATILDLPTLIPVGGVAGSAVKGAGGVALAAGRMAAGNAGAIALQEAGLHTNTWSRTTAESAYAVGSGAVLGAFLGGAVKLLSPAEKAASEAAAMRALRPAEADAAAKVPDAVVPSVPVSSGAAATEKFTREDLTPAGTIGKTLTKYMQINPNNRLNMSPSAAAREIGQQASDNAIYQTMHEEGKSLGQSAELLSRMNFNSRMGAAMADADKIYTEYRKAIPSPMSKAEFDTAVGYAMRRGDHFADDAQAILGRSGRGDEAYVDRAAQMWRDKVADPFKKDAIETGTLPADADVTTSASWLHRWWNKQALMQNEQEAKGVFQDYFVDRLTGLAATDAKAAKEFSNAETIREIASDAARAVYDKLTGRTFDEEVSSIPDWIVPVVRGPLKERTFNIPDALVEKYLHHDVRDVMHKAARTMAADNELARKFGRADMRDQIGRVVAEYEDLRNSVYAAKTVEEIRAIADKYSPIRDALRSATGADTVENARAKVIAYLQKSEKADLRDIKALRDLVRGNYPAGEDNVWSRISNVARAYNYVRLMGGMVIANMSDALRPAMVHGIVPYMRDGIAPLLRNLSAVKMSVAEAQQAGLVLERVMQSRLMSMAEIGDRYAENTAIERILQNGMKIANRWNGILHFTDANQAIASVMTQNRIIEGILKGGDERYLAYLGISRDMVDRLRPVIEKAAEKIDGVWVANTSKWDDASGALARAYRGAVLKDVDSMIVQRSAGDVPLFANTATGKVILQFRTFNMAAHQRILIRGLQESPVNFVSGVVALTSLGMMAAYLRAVRGGQDRYDKFMQAAENPGYLIGEGLDLSGIFTIPFELSNDIGKIIKYDPIKDPIKAAFGNPGVGESQRYASRGIASTLLGPSASMVDLASQVAQQASGGGSSTPQAQKAFARNAASFIPFYSYPGMREAINMVIDAR